jgi:hypothetical protein
VILTSAIVAGEFSFYAASCHYLRVQNPRYPLRMRVGSPQSRSGLFGEDRNFLRLPGNMTTILPSPSPWPSHLNDSGIPVSRFSSYLLRTQL